MDIKLFGKWDLEEVEIKNLALKDKINLKPIFLPHTSGRHEHKRFGKHKVPIVERLANRLMGQPLNYGVKKSRVNSKNAGKKARALKVVERALEIIHLKTGRNPVQVLVEAIQNAAIREETTRIIYGGVAYLHSVDVSPTRMVDLAIRYIAQGAAMKSYRSVRRLDECLAEEIIAAANYDRNKSYAIKKKEEIERIAASSR